ncbi:MAG: N-acetylmuramoyl-L-alanine amidase [Candidatus Saganbacteria bacterium]|nr:N-acetylmuramoyl-L-alanine amidase [Candidatus Saganbacteria bacterium]
MLKRILILGLILLNSSFVISHSSLAADPVRLERLEMKKDRGYDYLDVYTSGWSDARGLLLENKLYIDFPGAVLDRKFELAKRKLARVGTVRVAQKDPRTVRVTVTLKREIDYDLVNVFGRNKTVIELGDRQNGDTKRQLAWESKFARKKAAALKPLKLAPAAAPADRTLKHRVIVLDPGHGGDDPGAVGRGGRPEKELTLLTAQACAARLRAAGATVYLTRHEDRRNNLRDVVNFANRVGADIFLCIHYNSSDSPGVAGSETYYCNPVSRRFAETMHETIVRGLRRKDRGLHRVGFYTIRYTRMPGVLIEPVYLSNDAEYNLADSAAFREKLADSLAKGVKQYFRNKFR